MLLSGLSPLKILFKQRFLIVQLVRRDIVGRTSGTLMGGLWLIAQPALQVMAFWFLLDFVFQARSPGRITFLDYFLMGMLPWLFFSEVLNRSIHVLSEFGALYQRTRFPVEVLPLLPLVLNLIIYLPVFMIVAIYFQGWMAGLKAAGILLVLFVWTMPFAYLLAVMGLFVREVRQVFPFFLTMVLYVTPILYAPDMLPASVRWAMAFNPMADVIALIQGWLHDFPIERGNWLRPLIIWIILVTPAFILFRRTEPQMREML
ncbi:MAG: ABC transporter permease [Gammaproteobacteria bacterium]|nr:ABC transporter permease [Gammaproteobacteria bacterium]